MINADEALKNLPRQVVELQEIRAALYAVDAAVTGLDCNDTGAQEGVSYFVCHIAHKIGVLIAELGGKESEGEQ